MNTIVPKYIFVNTLPNREAMGCQGVVNGANKGGDGLVMVSPGNKSNA